VPLRVLAARWCPARELDGPRRPLGGGGLRWGRKTKKCWEKMVKQNVGTFSKMLTNIITKMLMKPFEQMLDSTIFVYTNVGATFQKKC
jgi:hypothetical protein